MRARSAAWRGWSAVDLGVATRPLLVAQGEFLDLAGRGLGQLLDELDPVGGLVVGDDAADVLDELVLSDLGVLLEDHERLGPLAPAVVRHADHGGLQHGRVADHGLLDLDGGNVLAARDDHVLGPIAQLDNPSGCRTPRSPEWNQPPRNACSVAAGSSK